MEMREQGLYRPNVAEEGRLEERRITEAGSVGVGGAAEEALGSTPFPYSARQAGAALDRWDGDAESFPYAEVLGHYQAVGRLGVGEDIVGRLRTIAADIDEPPLSCWLPMTVDQATGDYATYAGLAHLDWIVQIGAPCMHRTRVDAVIAAAVGELIRCELSAYVADPRDDQGTRARAVVRLLTWMGELTPEISINSMVPRLGVAAMNSSAHQAGFVAPAVRAVGTLLAGLPPEITTAVRRTLLPTTRLHDERMFVRVIQVFEGMYRQIACLVADATDALVIGDGARAAHQLNRATTRLRVVSPLFRILTTMPADSFAVIREYTRGRSAIQSAAYWEVETRCAPRRIVGTPTCVTPEVTAQEAFLAVADGLHERTAVEDAMRELDDSWRAMKLGHWGIALKIIGTVRGTGGTDGADYLRMSAETRLFPALAEDAS